MHKKPKPPNTLSDEDHFKKYGKEKTKEWKENDAILLKRYQESLKFYERKKVEPLKEEEFLKSLDLKKNLTDRPFVSEKEKILYCFNELRDYLSKEKEADRVKKGKVFNEKIASIIESIRILHQQLIQKLPEEMKITHQEFKIQEMLKDLYSVITYKQIEKFVTVLEFLKIVLIDFLFIIENYQKFDKKIFDEVKDDVEIFRKNTIINVSDV